MRLPLSLSLSIFALPFPLLLPVVVAAAAFGMPMPKAKTICSLFLLLLLRHFAVLCLDFACIFFRFFFCYAFLSGLLLVEGNGGESWLLLCLNSFSLFGQNMQTFCPHVRIFLPFLACLSCLCLVVLLSPLSSSLPLSFVHTFLTYFMCIICCVSLSFLSAAQA